MRTNRFARFVALPALAAGTIGLAALGLAGTASAAGSYTPPEPRPGIVAIPNTHANPAASAYPGGWWHRHHPSLLTPSAGADFLAPYGG
ncbi:hypothetical protein ACWDTP_23035 [Mycobacterium sp. NPDC003449]